MSEEENQVTPENEEAPQAAPSESGDPVIPEEGNEIPAE